MVGSTLRGVFAPTLTPVDEDLRIDVARWIEHSKSLLANGCNGLCPFGTTGEATSFSVGERIDALEQLVNSGVSAAKLMPGTGCSALMDTVRLTEHAAGLGCGGVLMLPPFYYKGVSDEGIFRSIAEVIERVGDARLRVYLYHIPPQAVVGFSLDLIERLINAYPGTVVGIKDSSGDWNNLHGILTRFPGFGTFTGSEAFLLQTLRLGGAGSINAVANVIAPIQQRLFADWDAPDAEQLQAAINEMRPTYQGFSAISALKAVVAHYRHDPAWARVRPPLVELDENAAQTVISRFAKLPLAAEMAL